jgi:formate--tetrahydrofolate ligase
MEGLGMRGVNVGGALRQPSGGPTMNVKGTAAGGGNSLLIPMTEFSLGLTGDINDIMNAHNLAMVAMTARMQHERNYNDEQLARLTGMRRLDIDPTRVEMGWIIDFAHRPCETSSSASADAMTASPCSPNSGLPSAPS